MATATVVPVSSSSITTRATSATTRSTAKSLLKETMGDASAKRYEYLFDDDDFTLPLADATTVVTTDSPEDSHDDNDDGGGRESHHDEHADHDDRGDSHTTTLRRVERELRASLFRIQQQDELLKRQQQQFQDQHHATQRAIQQCRDVDRKLDVLAQAVVTPLKQQLRAEQQARQQERVKTRQLQELLLQQQQQEDQPAPASSMQQQQQQQQQEYVERTQFQQEQLVLAKDEETKRIVRELVLELEATNQQHQQTIRHMERNFDMERAEWTKKVQDLQRQLRTQTEEAARVVIELKGALEASENSRLEHNLEQGQFASEEDEGVQQHAQEHHQAVTVQKQGKHVASNGVMKLETADDPAFEQQQPPFHGVPVTPDHNHHPTTTSPTATTTTTLVQSLASNDPDVIQAGIALADSLIELLLQGSRDTEVSVLEQMEVLDQLLGGPETNEEEDAILRSRSPSSLENCIEEDDDDQGDQDMYYDELDTRSVEQEHFILARQGEDDVSNIEYVDEHDQVDENDETNATIQFQEQEEYEELFLRLFERVRELEQERDFMVQESLDMLEAARLANGLELQFQLAEMKEHMDRTIQIRLMEELQKNRTIHVVPEE